MGNIVWFLTLFLSWVSFIPDIHGLQTFQTQLLLQLRKHLEYPWPLDTWENDNGEDVCRLPATQHMSIVCDGDSVTELKIMGGRLSNVTDFHGFAIPNQTLSQSFSIDSFVTTLTRLSSLKVLTLVSLGIWGKLPDKIHRLSSTLEFLDMSSNFLYGEIPPEFSRLVNLQSLTFDSNFINDTVPEWLSSFSNLTYLSLKNNMFKGEIPSSLCKMTSLNTISFSHNQLSGKLPDFATLTNLHLLDLRENQFDSELPLIPTGLTTLLLSKNSISGEIPPSFGKLNQLQHLDLSYNSLTGTPLSALFSLPNISYLNLASNKLSGSFPDRLTCGNELGFVDISSNRLMGSLPNCLGNNKVVKFEWNCFSLHTQQRQYPESHCKVADIEKKKASKWRLIGIIGGIVLLILVLAPAIVLLLHRRRLCIQNRSSQHQNYMQENSVAGISSELLANARFISQASKLGAQGAPTYRSFSFEEMEEATNNFDKSTFLGEGSLGKVYKGRLENGTYVAIRVLAPARKYSIRNLKVRLDLLSKLRHPNLVSLLGHCIDGSNSQDDSIINRIFLVQEYVPNGNFHSHLSETSPEKALMWSDRLAILIGVAKAVHFLHTGVPASVSNRLKSNNILIDEHRIAKLSDYGMSIMTEDFEKLEVSYDLVLLLTPMFFFTLFARLVLTYKSHCVLL
ncbi:probable inactive leucine-rich repeat receptor-like protein kinase At3g03770 isoform X1 [Impatiens glandulifera]|uniref:probable inactive leucine-rich repeat receptor-like protein kinase At3g03770 isoform X1 n=1 Tax=Impatiens glandulifera TaxID=253017 RepID=UPI001FB1062B|nr:probable inactive leucine-rich repeat receptor-like protein kinase At3g03770 isoform X1 [Impatiens glandulifera]